MFTYGELTRRIKFEVSSDRFVDDTDLRDIVNDSIRDIAMRCIPLSLVSQSNAETILRWIDNLNFIRMPMITSGVTSEKIDIDDLLMEAVLFSACKSISRDKKEEYESLIKTAISNYHWAIYEGETNVLPIYQ
ncbi:hypothetical protein [Sulfuricurvum sp.]|uniref:hypothetical protein n=1 Tax=Sulfuricurvum sp. TaxID=2025608 RepID=UPI002638CA59|nr:hypothetical protein [Sulfuricurvum sp.]MDD2267654.1 hypothetical protein [Sulfuricurvum sp.]MDD2784257.1 hypothetical protein [Sulfuricurvum sp.]